jgi:hypothetical protein
VALLSETHVKPHERFSIQNHHVYRIDRHPGRKGGTAVAIRKGIPHSHVDLPPLFSVEATGVCIPIDNKEILLAAVYKSPGHTWSDADVAELLNLRHKCILAGDLNAKHPAWNSAVSNPSSEKLLQLFDSKGVLFQPSKPARVLRFGTPWPGKPTTAREGTGKYQQSRTNINKANVQKTGQSVQAPTVNKDPLDIFRALTVVQQIMAELQGTASEETKFLVIAKIVYK